MSKRSRRDSRRNGTPKKKIARQQRGASQHHESCHRLRGENRELRWQLRRWSLLALIVVAAPHWWPILSRAFE